MSDNNNLNEKTRIWLVGGSQGIGLALSRLLLEKGCRLVLSSRQAETDTTLQELHQQYPSLTLLNCDVMDESSCRLASEQAWQILGGMDIWIYNVGAYSAMSIDNWQLDEFKRMNQSNYMGAVVLMNYLAPKFLQQGSGQWCWNISLSSDFGLPYGGAYSAPKAALQNLAESLQPELKQHNIRLQVINHGFVKTRLTAQNDFDMPGLMEPQQAAKQILSAMQSNQFELRFPYKLAWTLGFLKRLPKNWALALTTKLLKKSNASDKMD